MTAPPAQDEPTEVPPATVGPTGAPAAVGWNAEVGVQGEPAASEAEAETVRAGGSRPVEVTVLDGATFAVSDGAGDLELGVHGLYMLDTRVISRLVLRVDGRRSTPLSSQHLTPFSCRFVGRIDRRAVEADSSLIVVRSRSVGSGLSEWIELRNYSAEEITLDVELAVGTDFAGLFEVKAGRARGGPTTIGTVAPEGDRVVLRDRKQPQRWQSEVRPVPPGARLGPGQLQWTARIAPGGRWRTCVEVAVRVGEQRHSPAHPCGADPTTTTAAVRLASWRTSAPHVSSDDPAIVRAVEGALEDLGMLRMFDPAHPDRMVVAAGAPWYMTLFGRDALLTAWMTLPLGPELALGVLRSLADRQGERDDPATEEEPGRILHEVRYDRLTMQTLGGHSAYYGSVDATALFVMLTGELARWGVPIEQLAPLLDPVDRALHWLQHIGDRDGDGFVEYQRATERGLRNQGWKDSWDGVRFHDGRLAEPPIALAEVQGYTYAALLARAVLAELAGDAATAAHRRREAAALQARFDQAFWDGARGWYAMALDGDKRRADALASNLGHCLWSGIVPERRRAAVAALLVDGTLASGFGLRTLASSAVGFNPLSYHCGSVWPHDTAIAIAGLSDTGFPSHAAALTRQLLDASVRFDGRLPELYGGFDRQDFDRPIPYPASCSPQAWSAAAPLLLLRSMLGLRPDVPNGIVRLAAHLPPGMRGLRAEGLWLAGRRVTIEVDPRHGVEVIGLDDLRIERGPAGSVGP